jgi:RNA polymerase sigma-70 factor (ECF subfamily)
MDDDWLVWRYEASRPRLRGMAYRMLGSASDADDAVQEAWIHIAGGDATAVANLEGWFTTIVTRVCLDMLRARKSRREDPVDAADLDRAAGGAGSADQEAVLADTVGIAMLVVLDTLGPAERVAFVLHEMFGIPFGEIASMTGRTSASARQLASRARRRIRGGTDHTENAGSVDPAHAQWELAEAFLTAARGGDLTGLIAVLDPDVVLHGDAMASPSGRPLTIHGAERVANASRMAASRTRFSDVVLIDGTPGIAYAPRGRLTIVLAFRYGTSADGRTAITGIEVIAEPDSLRALDLSVPA